MRSYTACGLAALCLLLVPPAPAEEPACEHHQKMPHHVEMGMDPVSDLSLFHLDSAWEDQGGRTRQLADWRGQPILLAMVYTHCDYACPRIVQDLRLLRERLADEGLPVPHVVLASFDSERDEPARLRTYAEAAGLDAGAWTLLHGAPESVRELAAALGIRYRQEADGMFAHSNLITLLNGKGEVACRLEGLEQSSDAVVRTLRELTGSL